MTLLNVGHQNNLGTTNTGYKFKIFTPTLLTDHFQLKHTSGNVIFCKQLLSPRFFKKASGILQSPLSVRLSVRPSVRHAISS